MKEDINENEVKELIQKIEHANRTKMEVLDYKPKGLTLKWSQVVKSTDGVEKRKNKERNLACYWKVE